MYFMFNSKVLFVHLAQKKFLSFIVLHLLPCRLFAISAIRRSKNEKFCKRKREKGAKGSFSRTEAATLHYGLKLVGGVVRKIGNCFGAAFSTFHRERITLD